MADWWNNFKKWALKSEDVPVVPAPKPTVLTVGDWRSHFTDADLRMIDEPVVSFLNSLARDKGRYKLTKIDRLAFTGEVYHWMHDSDGLAHGFFHLIDKKTGAVYTTYSTGSYLMSTVGLPFNLNHWESKAIVWAFRYHRLAARERRSDMNASSRRRKLEAEWAQEKIDRQEFAHQFR